MSIHKIGSDLVRPLPERESGAHGRKSGRDVIASSARTERGDQVGFSAEGLALADKAGAAEGSLPSERFEAIRQRIAHGAYDDPAVAEEVARRLLASGDLALPA